MESLGSIHPDLRDILVLLEDLLEKCCMHVDGVKLSQNEPKSEDQALDKMLNYNDGREDTFYEAAESSCPTEEGKMKEDQLMPLKESLLIKDDEIVINQIMVSLLDKCCENIQENSACSCICDQSGKESDKAEQKDENSVVVYQDTSIGEEDPSNVENQISNQNDLEKGSLVQKFIVQKNSLVHVQNKLNPSSTTEVSNCKSDENRKTEQEVFVRETLSKSQNISSIGTASDEEPVEVIDVEDNDTGKKADDISFCEMKSEKIVLVNNALPLNTLCSNLLKQYPAEIQHLFQPESLKILALRHNRDQKVCQTHLQASKVDTACIKEQDLGEGNKAMMNNNIQVKAVNSYKQMKTEALEKRIDNEKNKDWDHLVMISNATEQDICENKITFVQSLGLSPLPIEKALKDESSAVSQQLQSLFQAEENTMEPREIDTACTENEVFRKIEIEEELHLEMDDTIPCKKLKLENDASDKDCQSSKTRIAVCQMPWEENRNRSEGVHNDLMLKDPTFNANMTISVHDDSSKHNDVVEYEPQITLQETKFENTTKIIANNNRKDPTLNANMTIHVHDDSSKHSEVVEYEPKIITKFENTSKIDANNNRKEFGGPLGHTGKLMEDIDLSKLEGLVVGDVQYRLQSPEQLVPSTVNTLQTLAEDTESFYEEENPKFEKSPDFDDKEKDRNNEPGDNTNVNDSIHGVTDRTKCFKWKYTPSYDTDAVVPNAEQEDCGSPCRIMPITSCKKPIRLGLSRKQSRVVSLHPYIKKHRSTNV